MNERQLCMKGYIRQLLRLPELQIDTVSETTTLSSVMM